MRVLEIGWVHRDRNWLRDKTTGWLCWCPHRHATEIENELQNCYSAVEVFISYELS